MSKELYLKIPKKINYFLNQLKDQDPFMYNFMNQVYMTIKEAEIPIEEGGSRRTASLSIRRRQYIISCRIFGTL